MLMPVIYHLDAPEDLVLVNHGKRVIASSLDRGGLYSIDTKTRRVTKIDVAAMPEAPDRSYRCTSLRKSGPFITHGLSIKPNADGHDRLFVVRHGGREAVEIFRFSHGDDVSSLQWLGCVPLPKGFSGNAVVGRSDGGFYATSMTDMGNTPAKEKLARLYAGVPSGAVLEWTPAFGYRTFLDRKIAGPNGIELSADESKLYVAAWSGRQVWQFNTNGPKANARHTALSFMPDNLRWSNSGALLAAGVQSTPSRTMTCAMTAKPNERCVTQWSVATISPNTMSTISTISGGFGFGDVSTALQVRSSLWLGSFGGTSVGIWPVRNLLR